MTIVCKECKETTKADLQKDYIEINFFTKEIYFNCPLCKKINKMKLYEDSRPLPKIRTM